MPPGGIEPPFAFLPGWSEGPIFQLALSCLLTVRLDTAPAFFKVSEGLRGERPFPIRGGYCSSAT